MDVASYGCIAVIFGVVPVVLLGRLAGELAGSSSESRWIGRLLGLVIFVVAVGSFYSYERRLRRRATRDHRDQVVEDIHVDGATALALEPVNDNEPIIALDIGDNRILYLQGQWLRDPRIYGAREADTDPASDALNGLSEPFAFPTSSFTVARLPHSGRVLGIRVTGEYAAPRATLKALRLDYDFASSELFDGRLEDLPDILAREHRRRRDRS